ncbi:MAG TPA: magnesium transporter CorA family protein [Kofleriaceae bacterium]|nr:magnesium transporter CorA family protein [Kofleriaceae bacterium]
MGTTRLVVDVGDEGLPTEVDIERLGELLPGRDNRLWLDVCDPGPDEVAMLRSQFAFHELTLDEMTRPHERPRCDAHRDYYFIVVYAAEQVGDEFRPRELNMFWGPNYLVTIHRQPTAVVALLAEARRRWEQHEGRCAHGVSCLAYTLFESLVDGYFAVQDTMRERIERIEEAIFKGEDEAAAALFRLRKELLQVPRLLAPTSHVLAEVLRRGRAIPEALRPYFDDVQDHSLHVLAEMDTYRDLLATALDVQVFYSFTRLGHIMKRLTAVTVIIMVPNFVASIYGMNFEHLFPPREWRFGFLIVVAFLAVMVVWGFIHSRLLRWL